MKVLTSLLSSCDPLPHVLLQRLEGMTTQQYYPILESIEYVIDSCSTSSPLSPPPSSTGMTLMHLSPPSHMSQQSFHWQSKRKISSTRWDFIQYSTRWWDIPYMVMSVLMVPYSSIVWSSSLVFWRATHSLETASSLRPTLTSVHL